MNPGKKIALFSLLIVLPFINLICQIGSPTKKDSDTRYTTNRQGDVLSSSPDGKKSFFYAGILTGVTFNNYVVKISTNEFRSFSDPSPFAGISLKFLNSTRGLGILFQSAIGPRVHHYSYLIKNTASDDYYETTLKSLASTSRIGFTVFRPKKSLLTHFVETGFLTSIYLNQKYENYKSQVYTTGNIVFTSHDQNKLNSVFYYGVFVQTGLMFNINNVNSFILSGGYDFMISSGSERIQSCDLSINYILKFK
jgi:hypothetical protein